MSKYLVETETQRDENGRITRTGASWTETSPWLEKLLLKLIAVAVFATLGGTVWAMAAGALNPMLIGGLLGDLAAIFLLLFLPGSERAVYFYADGRIITPHGISYRPFLGEIGGGHEHIVSIEARTQHDQPAFDGGWARMFELVIVSVGGDLICVSRNLREPVALKAAAQLSQSLAAIRKQAPDAFTTLSGEP
jgi:hypothetical protein